MRQKLTKEDFEREGWLVVDKKPDRNSRDFPKASVEPYWEIHAMGRLCDLYYRSDIGKMQITIKAGHVSVFHGSCDSIDDLRTICRLVDFAKPWYDDEHPKRREA